ncbi:MAG: flagellar basal body-associated FliL family protein [Actinobacteria bacterium]|nr:flagellar basal body-associated FliL family protein [Actinomycetota bacterium]
MAVSVSGPGTRQSTSAAGTPKVPEGGEERPKSKKMLLILVVLILVALAGGYFVVTKVVMKPPPHYGPNNPPPSAATYSLPSETVNLSDGSLLQVTVVLQLTTVASAVSVSKLNPQMENALIQDCGTWTYSRLLAPGGKAMLSSQLLHSFQAILKPVDGGEQVTSVYFTAFTLQAA